MEDTAQSMVYPANELMSPAGQHARSEPCPEELGSSLHSTLYGGLLSGPPAPPCCLPTRTVLPSTVAVCLYKVRAYVDSCWGWLRGGKEPTGTEGEGKRWGPKRGLFLPPGIQISNSRNVAGAVL